jgi:hypothetical protein
MEPWVTRVAIFTAADVAEAQQARLARAAQPSGEKRGGLIVRFLTGEVDHGQPVVREAATLADALAEEVAAAEVTYADAATEAQCSVVVTVFARSAEGTGERAAEGADYDQRTVVIDPDEPACVAEDHMWALVSVCGHGAGTITTEQCPQCRWRRITDTWGADDVGGQGVRIIRYAAE